MPGKTRGAPASRAASQEAAVIFKPRYGRGAVPGPLCPHCLRSPCRLAKARPRRAFSVEDVGAPRLARTVGRVVQVFPDGTSQLQLQRSPEGTFGFCVASGDGRRDSGMFPSAFWPPQTWILSKPRWCLLASVRGFFLSSGALDSENFLSKGLEFSPRRLFLESQSGVGSCWQVWVAVGRLDFTVRPLSADIFKIRISKANFSWRVSEMVRACLSQRRSL